MLVRAEAQSTAHQETFSPVPEATAPVATSETRTAEDLLAIRLAPKGQDEKLTPEESINLIHHCIRLGHTEQKSRSIVGILGFPGSGKSVLSNYLSERELQSVPAAEVQALGDPRIIVKDRAHGGAFDEIATIGHGTRSQTFIPQLIHTAEGDICDCPGLETDNRGFEIKIANAVNTGNLFKDVNARFLIVFDSRQLATARGFAFSQLLMQCAALFGSIEQLRDHLGSVRLLVTMVPTVTGEQQPLHMLQQMLREVEVACPIFRAVRDRLAENVLLYHPLDEKLSFSGGFTRAELIRKIFEIPVMTCSDRFAAPLSAQDILALQGLTNTLATRIRRVLSEDEERNFQQIRADLNHLQQLKIIQQANINTLISTLEQEIHTHFHQRVESALASYQANEWGRAGSSYGQIKTDFTHFTTGLEDLEKERIKHQIELPALEREQLAARTRDTMRLHFTHVQGLEREFQTHLQSTRITEATQSLDRLRESYRDFERTFGPNLPFSMSIHLLNYEQDLERLRNRREKTELLLSQFSTACEEKRTDRALQLFMTLQHHAQKQEASSDKIPCPIPLTELQNRLNGVQIEELNGLHAGFIDHKANEKFDEARDTLGLIRSKMQAVHLDQQGNCNIPEKLDPNLLNQQLIDAEGEHRAYTTIGVNQQSFLNALQREQLIQAEGIYHATLASLRTLRGTAAQKVTQQMELEWQGQLEAARKNLGTQAHTHILELEREFDQHLAAGNVDAARQTVNRLDRIAPEKTIPLTQRLEQHTRARELKQTIDTLIGVFRARVFAAEWEGLDGILSQIRERIQIYNEHFPELRLQLTQTPDQLEHFKIKMKQGREDRTQVERLIQNFHNACQQENIDQAKTVIEELKIAIPAFEKQNYEQLPLSKNLPYFHKKLLFVRIEIFTKKFENSLSGGYIKDAQKMLDAIGEILKEYNAAYPTEPHDIPFEALSNRWNSAKDDQPWLWKKLRY